MVEDFMDLKKYNSTLFIFRQDLRIIDNTGLFEAVQHSKVIIPLFVFDEKILSDFPNHDARVGFLFDALKQLQKDIEALGGDLLVTYGDSNEIVHAVVKKYQCDAIIWNRSYGANSLQRDMLLQARASKQGIKTHDYDDYLLVEPLDVEQRKVFTPFYKLWMGVPKRFSLLPDIQSISTPENLEKTDRDLIESTVSRSKNIYRPIQARKQLINDFNWSEYSSLRNFPSNKTGTSRLSPYTRFGIISIRMLLRHSIASLQPNRIEDDTSIVDIELGITIDKATESITMDKKIFSHSFISELAWREFWQHIHEYFPWTSEVEFQEKRQGLNWNKNEKRLQARKDGKTGYPIVDAAMRQLKEEKRMHGRCRMIVASFLTKDLLIDWREGEKHFKAHLIDYDRNINVGNRQRSASVGPDPKPLRIFNPILQSQKFDADASYILKWLPELKGQDISAIHDPIKYTLDYIPPIVDHYVTSKQAKNMYYKQPYAL